MKLKNGSIFIIPLMYDLGWAFAKYLDADIMFPREDGRRNHTEAILRIHNCILKEKPKVIPDFSEIDLLLNPLAVTGINNRNYKQLNWEMLGYTPVIEEDYILPNVKSFWPPIENSEEYVVYENILNSFVGNGYKYLMTDKEKTLHLEFNDHIGMGIVMFRITMEFLKIQGKDIKEQYGLEKPIHEIMYNRYCDSPIFSQLPSEIKGKYQYWDL
ncbi:MAG: hypothetical protein U5N85_00680 [Arcicella sp.]|nr:hypothetical protein [Arcicella sp.]